MHVTIDNDPLKRTPGHDGLFPLAPVRDIGRSRLRQWRWIREREDGRPLRIRVHRFNDVPGDREAEARAAAVRVRGGTDLGAMPLGDIVAKLAHERDTRALVP